MKSKIVPCSAFGETNFSTEIKRFVLATDCLQLYMYTLQYFTQLYLKPITLSMEQKLIFNAITQINFRFSGGSQPPASRTFVPLCLPIPTLHGISPAILPLVRICHTKHFSKPKQKNIVKCLLKNICHTSPL